MSWFHTVLVGLLWGGPIALLAAALDSGREVGKENRVAIGDLAVGGALLAIGLGDGGVVRILIGCLVAIPVLTAVGAMVRWLLVERTSSDDPAKTVLPLAAMFGLAYATRALVINRSDSTTRSLDLGSLHTDTISTVAGNSVSRAVVAAFLVSIAGVFILDAVMGRTIVGRDLRAVSDNPDRAQHLGLDLRRWASVGLVISVAAAILGAVLFAAQRPIETNAGPALLIVAFEALMIGGAAARIRGPLIGGIVVGLLTALGERWIPGYGPILTGLALLASLVAMPDGLAIGVQRQKDVAI